MLGPPEAAAPAAGAASSAEAPPPAGRPAAAAAAAGSPSVSAVEVIHVAVTSGQLVPSLAKLLLFKLSGHFTPDQVRLVEGCSECDGHFGREPMVCLESLAVEGITV